MSPRRGVSDVLVVGGGQAGAEVVKRLRGYGFDGSITLIGEEPHEPYERPPLSKGLLKSAPDLGRLTLVNDAALRELDVTVQRPARIAALDVRRKVARDTEGSDHRFEVCVLATGARAVPPPWPLPEQVTTMRTIADAERLRGVIAAGRRVLVVGGGFLGLEIASTLVDLGCRVQVVEASRGVLKGRVSEFTAGALASRFEERGVTIHCGNLVVELDRAGDGLRAQLTDGATLEVDHLVYAAGAVANKEIAVLAGAEAGRGVFVDTAGRTSLPGLYAAGDVASYRTPSGHEVRIESVNNALTQAGAVAASIAGRDIPDPGPPTFWTEQVGVRVQLAGWIPESLDVHDVVASDDNGWAVERYVAGALVGIECVNSPLAYLRATRGLTDLRVKL